MGRDLFLSLPSSAIVKKERNFASTPACVVICKCKDNVVIFQVHFVYSIWLCVCLPSSKLLVWQSLFCNIFSVIFHNFFSLQNIHNFLEMCLQLVMGNCQQPGRNTNVTVIELTNHQNLETFTPHLQNLVPYYLQVKGVL